MATAFLENTYSFRVPVAALLRAPTQPSQAQLRAIANGLQAADDLYGQRRYQDAIASYNAIADLIYALLVPGWTVGGAGNRSIDPRLFAPLLSASTEWLNVIGPDPVDPVVRGRVAPDPAVIAASLPFTQVGVMANSLASTTGIAAKADLATAQRLASGGNMTAASFFLKRSLATDAKATNALVSSPGRALGATDITVDKLAGLPTVLAAPATEDRTVGTAALGTPMQFSWKNGDAPPLQTISDQYYGSRLRATQVTALRPIVSVISDLALNLPHIYYYVIPAALAECHHALGDYAQAEGEYFTAAAYQYLNPTIEAPFLVQRLVLLYLDWGNALFRIDQAAAALPIYQNAMNPDLSVPTSRLFTTASLKPGADPVRTTLQNIPVITADPTKLAALGLNPVTTADLLDIHQQILKIQAGLDFWGHWHATVPIWTFDYLQSVAINFAQLAVSAERDMISYWERADAAQLTRTQLTSGVAQANADVQAAKLQASAAQAEVAAYQAGLALANTRAANATANANQYAATSAQAIMHQALQAQLSGGDDGDASKLNQLADQMTSGPYGLSGSRGTLSAAELLAAARVNRDYEVDAMRRTAQELAIAATQAQAELTASQARAAAAAAGVASAQARASGALQMLSTFNDATFTPEVWQRLGNAQKQLYQRYLMMATRVAKLMQAAYNFENDEAMATIQADYSGGITDGLLGGEALLADVESFNYALVTTQTAKPQPLRQTISLANRFPFLFETQFRATGTMSFDTRLEDFDTLFPGTYAGRIAAVEVAVDGIVPVAGISGTLENGGISTYRTPASAGGGPKFRVQSREALVLSDYQIRNDALLIPDDSRMLKILGGAGVASTWTLSLPKGVNDIDYGALTDVRLTFYYKARFDPALRDSVTAGLAARPGFTARQRAIPLRWLYPDAFFHFLATGEFDLTLLASDFPFNQLAPVLTDIGVQLATDGSVAPAGLKIALATPAAAAPVTATMDAQGQFSSAAGNAWAPLASGPALGAFKLLMSAADNPGLVHAGALDLSPIANVGLLIGYSFTPRA